MGHIKDLPKSELAVDLEKNFEPKYLAVEKKADSIKKIKDAAVRSDKIFIATDPDREGEAIAQHVKEILTDHGPLTTDQLKRIVFHEITKEAVQGALKSPRSLDLKLVDAQVARRVLDRLVGYKLSPLLWFKVRKGLSAGRVQSVAVRLIVEREREIEQFVREHKSDIPKQFSGNYGKISYRLNPPKIVLTKGVKEDDLVSKLKAAGRSDVLREVTELDRSAILSKGVDEQLKTLGIRIAQTETLTVKPDLEKISSQAAELSKAG